jgi:hypothetical protein
MVLTPSKIAALVIALLFVVGAVAISGWDTKGVWSIVAVEILPLAMILFPDEISSFASPEQKFGIGRGFNSPTPPSMVTFCGWIGLVVFIPLLAYLLSG